MLNIAIWANFLFNLLSLMAVLAPMWPLLRINIFRGTVINTLAENFCFALCFALPPLTLPMPINVLTFGHRPYLVGRGRENVGETQVFYGFQSFQTGY